MGNIKKNLTGFRIQVLRYKINIAALLLVGIFLGWMGFVILKSPLAVSREVLISEGQGVYDIAGLLKKEGIIDNEFVFVVYTLVTGNEKKLQAGRYVFNSGAIIPVIVRSMAKGYAESDDLIITIPEGFNVFDIDKRLASFGLIKKGEFTEKYYEDEGQFFPDTYRFNRETCGMKREACVDEIAGKMKNHLTSTRLTYLHVVYGNM